MNQNASSREIVDRQMRAYNERDIDAYCALFAADAVISSLNDGKEINRGIEAIRAAYSAFFKNHPNLHYIIKSRTEIGDFVIDHELVTGINSGSPEEVIAIYEVRDSLIRSVRFTKP